MKAKRINIIGVGVDIIAPEDIEDAVMELVEKPGVKNVVFLSIWDLLKARHKGDFNKYIKTADLVLPISKSILRGAAFLKRDIPRRYNPFTTIIAIMSTLDAHYKSIFLLGGRPETLHFAKRNVASTFPNLKIFGMHPGYYHRSKEDDILKAIYKSSPSLVLFSDGVSDGALWAYRRQKAFQSSIFIYYKDAIGIFAKRVRRISEKTFDRGHEIWHELIRNPFKIFRIFPYMCYGIILIWWRLHKDKKLAEEAQKAKNDNNNPNE